MMDAPKWTGAGQLLQLFSEVAAWPAPAWPLSYSAFVTLRHGRLKSVIYLLFEEGGSGGFACTIIPVMECTEMLCARYLMYIDEAC